jgi:hypothetical protein
MKTNFENIIRLNIQRLADLKTELERELSDTRVPLEPQHMQSRFADEKALFGEEPAFFGDDAMPDEIPEPCQCALHDIDGANNIANNIAAPRLTHPEENSASPYDGPRSNGRARTGASHAPRKQPPRTAPQGRTAALIDHGRRTVYRRGLAAHGPKLAAGTAVIAVLVTILVLVVSRTSASWPASVAKVQGQVAEACQNPDVRSEPGQVNFACGKATRQILWVFALMTSGNDPNFADPVTGRRGLEPITPALGGQIAASLNLHHPYGPANPIDSLEVAARAINNIIGGATLTNANGHPVVQPGLESHPANCLRYTGSPAIIARAGFPNMCAKPVTRPAGQSALVADIYRKWVVGAAPATAEDAAVLFENALNPGDPRVQYILKHLPSSRPAA